MAANSSVVRAASVKLFDAADEEHLERGHERRSARAVKNFSHAGLSKIEVMQAEIAQIAGDQMLEERLAARSRKNISSPIRTYAGRSLRAATSEANFSVAAKLRPGI